MIPSTDSRPHRRPVAFLIALLAGLCCTPVLSQPSWPTAPIRFIVPYPAGGNADAVARLVANKLAAGLGQPVVVDNKAGAGGTIGTQLAAKSPSDGSTFLMTPSGVLTITPNLRKVPYDALGDLVPVARVSGSYGLVAARKDLPANSIPELIALARKDPGKLTFGSAGTATATHITGEIVHAKTGIKVMHVPYKGSVEALNDLVAGRIDLVYDPVAFAQAKAGKAKVLAVTSPQRHPELPDVPTMRELKIDVPAGSWFGVLAPRGTPSAVITHLAAEIEKVVNMPDTREQMLRFSQYPDYKAPDSFASAIREEFVFFKDLFAQTGMKLD